MAAGSEHPNPEGPRGASPSEGWRRRHISARSGKERKELTKLRDKCQE